MLKSNTEAQLNRLAGELVPALDDLNARGILSDEFLQEQRDGTWLFRGRFWEGVYEGTGDTPLAAHREGTTMPTIDVEFEVYCAKCGAGLCNATSMTKTYNRQMPRADVAPCENCIKEAKAEGDAEGYERGLEDFSE